MAIIDALHAGVAVADTVTKSLQSTVRYQRYGGEDAYGEKILGSVISMKAIVDWKQKQVRTMAGILTVSRAAVTFLDINALVAATNGDGINDEDIITLPDGTTGPILDMAGFIDPGTGIPIATEVYLG
jgi:hypothetical protein